MTIKNTNYRSDIDGLRAVAVLSVVGFHAFPQQIAGGYIGVDIFFVISGFLISTIIFGHLKSSNFDFLDFYARRVKRIFPALILVLLATFVLGWFVLLADEFKQLGKQILGGSTFASNFILWRESGYFDNSADTKPLLHLWSLAIEEQFYLIWPLLLWLAYKFKLNLLGMTLVIACISFVLNIISVQANPVAAFYSPQTRFWELMVGSVLAYLKLKNTDQYADLNYSVIKDTWLTAFGKRFNRLLFGVGGGQANVGALLGLFFIFVGFIFIKKDSYFPGWWAVLPTVGAALILASDSQAWLNRKILSNPVLVWFGIISYPLYLWHWPLLSFARILNGELPSAGLRLVLVFVSIVLAWLTYWFIERPVRFGKHGKLKIMVLIVGMIGVGCAGFVSFKNGGFSSRAVVSLNESRLSGMEGGDQGMSINDCGISEAEGKLLYASCLRDKRQPPRFALIGDSKAGAIYGGLVRTSHADGRWLFIGGTGSNGLSVLLESQHDIYKVYQRLTPMAFDAVIRNEHIETVVLALATRHLFGLSDDLLLADLPASKNYDIALQALDFSIGKLINSNKKVILLVDNPSLPDPKDCIGRESSAQLLNSLVQSHTGAACNISISNYLLVTKKYSMLLEEMRSKYPAKLFVFDTLKHMCDEKDQVCRTYKNGRLMYSYGDHISDYAAGVIGRDLNKFLSTY